MEEQGMARDRWFSAAGPVALPSVPGAGGIMNERPGVDARANPGTSPSARLQRPGRRVALARLRGHGPEEPASWAGVSRGRYLTGSLSQEAHMAAVRRFLVGSIRRLRENLAAFGEEHPELPGGGPHA